LGKEKSQEEKLAEQAKQNCPLSISTRSGSATVQDTSTLNPRSVLLKTKMEVLF